MASDILLLTGPHAGNVYPILSVVKELTRRGHRVTYQTTDDYKAQAEQAGASVLSYRSAVADINPAEVFAGADDGSLPHMMYLEENLHITRTAEAARDDDPPAVILYEDFAFIAGQLLAARWNRPAVRLSVGFATNDAYSFHDDYVAASGIPAPLTLERFRNELQRVLDTRGLNRTAEDFWHHIEDNNVVFIPQAFQFKGDAFDERFAFVGPCLEGGTADSWTPPDNDRPIVLISLGTAFNDHPDFFRACADAFADTRWHAVMTFGQRVDPNELGTLPPNVEAHSWLSHMAVLQHAQVCVTHGGMGTVMQALHYGRPVVAVPQYAFDVIPMAKQVGALGLGLSISAESFDAAALPGIVDELSMDGTIGARVQEMQRQVRSAGGAARAADLIVSQLPGNS